jgi:hypothetical protein
LGLPKLLPKIWSNFSQNPLFSKYHENFRQDKSIRPPPVKNTTGCPASGSSKKPQAPYLFKIPQNKKNILQKTMKRAPNTPFFSDGISNISDGGFVRFFVVDIPTVNNTSTRNFKEFDLSH